MFAHLHIFGFLAGGAVVAMILVSVVGGILEKSQQEPTVEQEQFMEKLTTGIMGFLFVTFCVAMIPLFLRFFTHMQGLIGNGELGMVKFIRQHERTITFVVWALIGISSLFMVPQMIREAGVVGGAMLKRKDQRLEGR